MHPILKQQKLNLLRISWFLDLHGKEHKLRCNLASECNTTLMENRKKIETHKLNMSLNYRATRLQCLYAIHWLYLNCNISFPLGVLELSASTVWQERQSCYNLNLLITLKYCTLTSSFLHIGVLVVPISVIGPSNLLFV